ncbi:MAG: acyl-CoA dehydrogenase family protein, partial [Planctomycetota bacterium]
DELVRIVENDFTMPDGPEDTEEAKELYFAILEEVGRFVAKEVAPVAHEFDSTGSKLVDGEVVAPESFNRVFEGLKAMDLHGLNAPRSLGGMNAPLVLYFALAEVMARADCGVMTHHGFHGGIGMSLLQYAAHEGNVHFENGDLVVDRFEQAMRECFSGEAWGAMVLTEPDAGSDLGRISTRAVKDAAGVWRVTGEKIFITSGHGQWHIVLARSSDAPGLEGLSLYLVPRIIERDGKKVDNFVVTKVEKKVGHNSSSTCSLLYEDSEAELIGQPGEGFKLMLVLMNNARVAVSFEALGLCESAHRMATEYTNERESMGKRLSQHELVAKKLLDMDTDIRGFRALCFEAARTVEMAHRIETKLRFDAPKDLDECRRLERKMKRLQRYGRKLTPLVKYITSEGAVAITRENMQLHGGMGYITETGADKLLRDALVLPVYEGTSQIQALMALKDHLGFVTKNPAAFLRRSARARVNARRARGTRKLFHEAEVNVNRAIETIVARIFGTKLKAEWAGKLGTGPLLERMNYLTSGFMRSWDAKEDFAQGLVFAEPLCEMLAHVATAKVLLTQAEAHAEREPFARRYIRKMTPRVHALLMEIQMGADLDELAGVAQLPQEVS